MHSRFALVSAALIAATAVAGCSSGTAPAPSGPAAASAPSGSAAETEGSDAAACEGYGDVLTITANADIALSEGRIAQQEHDGWYRLATRVLARVPLGESAAVRQSIVALQEAAPVIVSGASWRAGIGSDAWNEADSLLGAACDEAGTELAIEGFTGG